MQRLDVGFPDVSMTLRHGMRVTLGWLRRSRTWPARSRR